MKNTTSANVLAAAAAANATSEALASLGDAVGALDDSGVWQTPDVLKSSRLLREACDAVRRAQAALANIGW